MPSNRTRWRSTRQQRWRSRKSSLHAAEGKTLGDVVAHEINDERPGDDRQSAGCSEQTQLVAGGTGGACHWRCKWLRRNPRERLGGRHLGPGGKEAEKGGTA